MRLLKFYVKYEKKQISKMKLKQLTPGQKFTTIHGELTFQLTKKTKSEIEFVNTKTGEIHKSTINDQTNFFII
jgi:hypothetical protein